MAGNTQAAGRAPIEREKWGTSLGGVRIGGKLKITSHNRSRE
jgi:hypothetical protein